MSSSAPKDPAGLVEAARRAISAAYAPYSNFAVGAAVMDETGRIFHGANVENASYGLTICAERVAVFNAVSGGARKIVAMAVVAKKAKPVSPCGACRQVLSEFAAPGATISSESSDGVVTWSLEELLPNAFKKSDLPPPGR